MKSSVCGFTAQAVVLAATLGLGLNGPHRASADAPALITQSDSTPVVTILSPVPRTSFSGIKPVEISAFYQGSATNQIVTLELYVDGIKAAQKVLDAPEEKGVVSFLVDASALTGGTHRIVVRASAADAEVASAKSSFVFEVPTVDRPNVDTPSLTPSQGAPSLKIENPAVDGQVQGKITLRIQATDPSGKDPYVSLFIDHGFKTLRNYAPYEFTWDTTEYANGYHTIEAFGYNDSQDVGHAQPLRIYVNNPGGRTERRTDLLDAPKHGVKIKSTPKVAGVAPMSVKTVTAAAPKVAKATPIRRRPTPAMLAAASPKAVQDRMHVELAKLPKLSLDELTLTGMPGLSSPFITDTALPKTATPVRGFKPLVPMAVHAPKSVLATTPGAAFHETPRLLAVKPALPKTPISTRFLTAPVAPVIKALVMTPAAKPQVRTLRVSIPTTHRTEHVAALHTLHLSSSIEWLRAAGERSILFNSTRLPLERPLTAHGSVMFGPLRQIFQQDGGSLMWQARTGTVTAHTGRKDIKLTIGQKTALVNKTAVAMDGVPYINSGRTMVPLSFVQTALDATVQYDPATGHLLITSNK